MSLNAKIVKLEVLYGAMHTIIGPLTSNVLRRFHVYSENKHL